MVQDEIGEKLDVIVAAVKVADLVDALVLGEVVKQNTEAPV